MEQPFNPLQNIFEEPEKGSPLHQDFESMQTGHLHNAGMFDEEGDAHGGEAINPGTGKPNETLRIGMYDGLRHEETLDSDDMLGDLKNPEDMSLEELMKAQEEDMLADSEMPLAKDSWGE